MSIAAAISGFLALVLHLYVEYQASAARKRNVQQELANVDANELDMGMDAVDKRVPPKS